MRVIFHTTVHAMAQDVSIIEAVHDRRRTLLSPFSEAPPVQWFSAKELQKRFTRMRLHMRTNRRQTSFRRHQLANYTVKKVGSLNLDEQETLLFNNIYS